ncbi:ABC transporter ATP-binding protein, partial [Pseudomonas fragi]|nr:ABC transporter ATP-binding protein [Pseudomonas sp. GC01]
PPLHVLTPALLARVYGVQARLEHCTNGHWMVMVEQPLASSLQRTIEKC